MYLSFAHWVFPRLNDLRCFQLLKRHPQARLGGGQEAASTIKVIIVLLLVMYTGIKQVKQYWVWLLTYKTYKTYKTQNKPVLFWF